jgi:hypothetical protein
MKGRIAVTLFALVLTACAGPVYHKQGITQAQVDRDIAECRFETLKATGSGPGGSIFYAGQQTIANDIATGIRQGEIMRTCLYLRGYQQK